MSREWPRLHNSCNHSICSSRRVTNWLKNCGNITPKLLTGFHSCSYCTPRLLAAFSFHIYQIIDVVFVCRGSYFFEDSLIETCTLPDSVVAWDDEVESLQHLGEVELRSRCGRRTDEFSIFWGRYRPDCLLPASALPKISQFDMWNDSRKVLNIVSGMHTSMIRHTVNQP